MSDNKKKDKKDEEDDVKLSELVNEVQNSNFK